MMSEHVGNWWRRFECCILNTKIVWSSNKFKKHWSARVTDEFSSETLILRKSLSSLHTKCVQFLSWPSLLFRACYAGDMMIPCDVSSFSGFILKITTKWILKMLKLGMVSSFHPHSMCKRVERVTAKTGRTSFTIWTISFEVSGFLTRTHLLHGHFIF